MDLDDPEGEGLKQRYKLALEGIETGMKMVMEENAPTPSKRFVEKFERISGVVKKMVNTICRSHNQSEEDNEKKSTTSGIPVPVASSSRISGGDDEDVTIVWDRNGNVEHPAHDGAASSTAGSSFLEATPGTERSDQAGNARFVFGSTSVLRIRQRRSEGNRPHKCIYCSKTFLTRQHQKRHRMIHTGEKPYSCLYCTKTFIQKEQLIGHTRTHTGERPYVCYVCNWGFSRIDNLNLHKFKRHVSLQNSRNRMG